MYLDGNNEWQPEPFLQNRGQISITHAHETGGDSAEALSPTRHLGPTRRPSDGVRATFAVELYPVPFSSVRQRIQTLMGYHKKSKYRSTKPSMTNMPTMLCSMRTGRSDSETALSPARPPMPMRLFPSDGAAATFAVEEPLRLFPSCPSRENAVGGGGLEMV